jgi:hypothetical protein
MDLLNERVTGDDIREKTARIKIEMLTLKTKIMRFAREMKAKKKKLNELCGLMPAEDVPDGKKSEG